MVRHGFKRDKGLYQQIGMRRDGIVHEPWQIDHAPCRGTGKPPVDDEYLEGAKRIKEQMAKNLEHHQSMIDCPAYAIEACPYQDKIARQDMDCPDDCPGEYEFDLEQDNTNKEG
jgi:hypothetical protein